MDDLWTTRDLPVLEAVVSLKDASPAPTIHYTVVVERTGLDANTVGRSIRALSGSGYIEAFGDFDWDYPSEITGVSERAYRAVGAWPTAEGLTDRLEAAFRAAAASEPDQEKRTKLQAVLGAFSGIGRAVTTDVLTQVVERQMGLG